MATCKEYNKFMRELEKNPGFEIIKSTRKSTIKVVHIESNQLYSVHPGDNAVRPLSAWMNKMKNQCQILT